ncbi:MAG: DUF4861 domain-containing protein [Prevotella sp.]|jgi:hypothetical protein
MKRNLLIIAVCLACMETMAQKTIHLNLFSNIAQPNAPVVLQLGDYGIVKSAIVMIDNKEIPCQLDDLDKDGTMDELCFITDMAEKTTQTASITLYNKGKPRKYPTKTYAEIVLRNPKIKEKNKQDIYLSSITIDKETTNPYNVLHHHGIAFENDMIAMRIYMDKRQTIDLYGKFHKGLELKETQFYTSEAQKAQGYGDDVLWVGNTFGLGALRGWNGTTPTMLDDVEHRTHRIVAQGPVRTIIEVEDADWTIAPGIEPVNMTLRYTLYAGHRDFDVDVTFNRDMSTVEFSTGVINVKNSIELRDGKGLRGCWGTDWPSADTINGKRETVGLGIYVPRKYRVKEMPANKDNYCTVIKPIDNHIYYSLAYTSANENFGFHSAEEWMDYLKAWKKRKDNPILVSKE